MNPPAAIRRALSVLVLASLAMIDDVQAGFIYSLRFDQTEYHVSQSGSVAVTLIRRGEVSGADTNRITDTNGVTSGNVKVNWDGGGATVSAAGNASYGTQFMGASKVLTASDITLNQLSLSGATGTQVSPSVREVNLGTLSFSVPTDGSTWITFGDAHASPFDDLVIGSGQQSFVIDSLATYGSAEIVGNPEPSTLLITGMGMLALAARVRRRLKR